MNTATNTIMTCGGRTGSGTNALKAVAGVDDVSVSLSAGEATVQYDEKQTSPDQLKSAVKGAGFGVDTSSAAQQPRSKGGCCS